MPENMTKQNRWDTKKTLLVAGGGLAAIGVAYGVYYAVNKANWEASGEPVPAEYQEVLAPYYPDIDLTRVRILLTPDLPLGIKYAAVTLQNFIFINSDHWASLDPAGQARLIIHELVHVSQWYQWWWLFPIGYVLTLWMDWDKRPYEEDAIARASTIITELGI